MREDLEREEAEESERLARAVEAFERWTFPGDDGGGGGEEDEERGADAGVGDDEEDVLCPVCATRRVMMNRHVLFCACGGFRITRADEKVGLAYLRRRLAETFGPARRSRVRTTERASIRRARRVRIGRVRGDVCVV